VGEREQYGSIQLSNAPIVAMEIQLTIMSARGLILHDVTHTIALTILSVSVKVRIFSALNVRLLQISN